MILIIEILMVPLYLPIIVVQLYCTTAGESLSPKVDTIFATFWCLVLSISKAGALQVIRGEHLLIISQNSILAHCIISLCTVVHTECTNAVVGKAAHCKIDDSNSYIKSISYKIQSSFGSTQFANFYILE